MIDPKDCKHGKAEQVGNITAPGGHARRIHWCPECGAFSPNQPDTPNRTWRLPFKSQYHSNIPDGELLSLTKDRLRFLTKWAGLPEGPERLYNDACEELKHRGYQQDVHGEWHR